MAGRNFISYLFSASTLRKSLFYFRNYGPSYLFHKAVQKFFLIHNQDADYERWIRERENRDENIEGQRKEILEDNPVISIVMAVYRTPIPLLRKAIQSVQTQTFPDWELVIANGSSYDSAIQYLLQEAADNDSRIKIITLEENLGIARNMNAALAAAAGDWVTFLDHDDMLAPFALYEVAETIRLRHKADFIYSDEDHMAADGKKRFEPHFKPSFSPETLLSYNYICHMIVIKKNLVAKIGNFRPEMEGSQDYDLILRAVEKASCVVRIPKILYHWRTSPTSVSDNPESKLHAYSAARAALTDCLKRRKLDGEVHDGQFLSSYQITYRIPENTKVSVIIPNKDHAGDLAEALESVEKASRFPGSPEIEIVIIENGSTDKAVFELYLKLKKNPGVKIIEWKEGFNYSALNNFGVKHASGNILLFLNNDVRSLNDDWIIRMVEYAVQENIGAVGAKLYYPDLTIQHAGIVVGIQNIAGHAHKNFHRNAFGYMNRLKIIQNVSAVTGACLAVRKSVFEEAGGMDEKFAFAFNDVDLCLKFLKHGYRNIFTPFAELIHHESKTRGYEDTSEKRRRFEEECKLFQKKWKDFLLTGDPYYNPNLTLQKEDFSIKV